MGDFQLLDASREIKRLHDLAIKQAKRDIKIRECWSKWGKAILAGNTSNFNGGFNATMGKEMVEAIKAYMKDNK